jgi:heat shock protein HslJ
MKGTLTATDITATKIYCAGPEMKAETALFAELAKGAKFEITTGSLTFPTRAGTPLEFTKRIEWY